MSLAAVLNFLDRLDGAILSACVCVCACVRACVRACVCDPFESYFVADSTNRVKRRT